MKGFQRINIALILIVVFSSCKKEEEPTEGSLPTGTTAYTTEQLQFVPYSTGSGEFVYKKAPDFNEEIKIVFKERTTPKQVYSWDQTVFNFEEELELEIDLKLRYLQTEETSRKTLAIYMPYRDVTSAIHKTVFETPISTAELEDGFFENSVIFHDTLTIEGQDWYSVFEISPLTSTDPSIDDLENYSKLFYSKSFGIIEMDQKNGNRWVLHP